MPDESQDIQSLIDSGRRFHQQGDHYRALLEYRKAFVLAMASANSGWMPLLYWLLGSEYRDCDEYHRAAEMLAAALAMLSGVEEKPEIIRLRASLRKTLAITLEDIYGAQKPEVLQLLEEARQEFQQLDEPEQVANICQHIGGVYLRMKRLGQADAALQEGLSLARQAGDAQLESWILDNMAHLEMEHGQYAMALELAERAREKALAVGDREAEGDTWVTEARVRLQMRHLEEAFSAAQTALDLYTENHNRRRSITARRALAAVLMEMKRYEEAVGHLSRALRTARQLDLCQEQAHVQLALAEVELARHNVGLAQEHASEARRLAHECDLDDLLDQADDLLRRCAWRKENE